MVEESKNSEIERGPQEWTMETAVGNLKALDTPLAKRYAENLLLQRDMTDCLTTMQLWESRIAAAENADDRIIAGCLFRDAITQFVGCFDKTAEFPLSADEIYGHDPEGLVSFKWFKDTRDAYTSHKFGAQRQCVVGVARKDGVTGLGYLIAKFRGQKRDDGPQLRGFMQTAAKFLDSRVDSLKADLMKEVEVMPMDDIAKLNEANVRTLKMEEARFTRADLQREKPSPKR